MPEKKVLKCGKLLNVWGILKVTQRTNNREKLLFEDFFLIYFDK